jgi:hypothetical protein
MHTKAYQRFLEDLLPVFQVSRFISEKVLEVSKSQCKPKWLETKEELEAIVYASDQTSLCRIAEIFEFYLLDLTKIIFNKNPNTLKSQEKISVSEIIEFTDRDSLISYIAERKILDLGHAGFSAILDFLREKIGIPLALTDEEISPLKEFFEVRNITVHNRGLINQLFLKRTGQTNLAIGQKYPLDWNYILKEYHRIKKLAANIDKEAISHLRLIADPE